MFGLAVPQPTPAIPLKDVNSSVIRRFTPRGIAMGKAHVCVLGDDAGVGIHCFGPENGFGELGTNAPPMTEEVLVPNSLGARSLAAGYYHTCAIWSDGGVRCWGMNNTGQLGTGDGQTRPAGEIVQVSGR
jgi:alpha-tubulin suppressor-like RCC1 family protein